MNNQFKYSSSDEIFNFKIKIPDEFYCEIFLTTIHKETLEVKLQVNIYIVKLINFFRIKFN